MYNRYLVTRVDLHLAKTLFSSSIVKFITFSSLILSYIHLSVIAINFNNKDAQNGQH